METFRTTPVLVAVVFCVASIVAGRWAMSHIRHSEFVHFSVNFPANPDAPVISRQELGGPWALLPDDQWQGYPPGGILVWGREGAVEIDLGEQGVLKRLLQPDLIAMGSHWIRNVGKTPRRIKMKLDMCGMDVKWETFEKDWDRNEKASTREIPPGKTFNMDWHVHVDPEARERYEMCNGSLELRDADTGEVLTTLPIRLINSRAPGHDKGNH